MRQRRVRRVKIGMTVCLHGYYERKWAFKTVPNRSTNLSISYQHWNWCSDVEYVCAVDARVNASWRLVWAIQRQRNYDTALEIIEMMTTRTTTKHTYLC